MTTKVTASVLADTAVTPGTYGGTQTLKAFTVDAQGRITYAANITSGVITAGTRGQGADIIVPTIQYNALGQIVAATNTTIRTATTSVTGVVQLADSVSNTSTTAAATASAVKAAYDAAASNASTALSSAQANTGAVNIALSNESLSRQANVGAVAISAKNADNLSSGTVASGRISGSYTGITGVGTMTVGSIPYATSAGSASSATNATYATSAGSATNASAATNATYATTAGSATYASSSGGTSSVAWTNVSSRPFQLVSSGSFAITGVDTFYTLASRQTFFQDQSGIFLLSVSWDYNFSYYRGAYIIGATYGLNQLASTWYFPTTTVGFHLGFPGSYGEYTRLYYYNAGVGSTQEFRVYLQQTTAYYYGSIPGGTGNWYLHRITDGFGGYIG